MPEEPTPTEDELEAIRASDPDPLGLMDVMELIAPEARVTGWQRLPGGFGAAMHRIDVTMPSGSETAFVLRRYLPETGDDARAASHEALTLEGLRGGLVPAPEVLWLDSDGTVFGRPALAMTLLPGGPRSADVAREPGLLKALAETLVSLRWVVLDDRFEHLDAHPDVVALTTPLREAVEGGHLPSSELVDTTAIARAVLDAAPDVAGEPAVLSHGDFHMGNLLFDDGRATGVVDWGSARVADPRSDVAYCALDLALMAGHDVARAFLDQHAALRGEMADEAWWLLRAATSAFPDPREWVPSWHAIGVEVTSEQVAERYVAWVESAMSELG